MDSRPEELANAKEYADTLREMVRHEDNLTNHRLTWMATLNGLMFTGLGFIWGKPYDKHVVAVLCVLGITICISAYLSLRLAEDARYFLHKLWKEKDVPMGEIPPIFGWAKTRQVTRALLPWNVLPLALISAWLMLFFVNIIRSN